MEGVAFHEGENRDFRMEKTKKVVRVGGGPESEAGRENYLQDLLPVWVSIFKISVLYEIKEKGQMNYNFNFFLPLLQLL